MVDVDDFGDTLRVPARLPRRVVSLTPPPRRCSSPSAPGRDSSAARSGTVGPIRRARVPESRSRRASERGSRARACIPISCCSTPAPTIEPPPTRLRAAGIRGGRAAHRPHRGFPPYLARHSARCSATPARAAAVVDSVAGHARPRARGDRVASTRPTRVHGNVGSTRDRDRRRAASSAELIDIAGGRNVYARRRGAVANGQSRGRRAPRSRRRARQPGGSDAVAGRSALAGACAPCARGACSRSIRPSSGARRCVLGQAAVAIARLLHPGVLP